MAEEKNQTESGNGNRDKFQNLISHLSEEEKKSLMDSDAQEIAERWEKMYEIPIKQSKFFLNDLFFNRSHRHKDDQN